MQITSGILTGFQSGNIDDFYAEVYPSLLTYAIRILDSDYSFMAEDCVQDAIFKAYGQRMTFITPAQFKSFLYSCVHNNAVTMLRKNRSRNNYLMQNNDSGYDMGNAIIEQETLDLLYEAISELPDDMRCIFELSFEQGLKNIEVARVLGISESAVKKRKMRMISILRSKIKDDAILHLLLMCFCA